MARSSIRYVPGCRPGRAARGSLPRAPSGETSTVCTPSRYGSSGCQIRRRSATAGSSEPPAATRRPRVASQRSTAAAIGATAPRSSRREGPIRPDHEGDQATLPLPPPPCPRREGLLLGVLQEVDQGGVRGRAACTWAGVSPRCLRWRGTRRCGRPTPPSNCSLRSVSSAICCCQASRRVGVGRGQGEGGQTGGGGLQVAEPAGPPRVGVLLDEACAGRGSGVGVGRRPPSRPGRGDRPRRPGAGPPRPATDSH